MTTKTKDRIKTAACAVFFFLLLKFSASFSYAMYLGYKICAVQFT